MKTNIRRLLALVLVLGLVVASGLGFAPVAQAQDPPEVVIPRTQVINALNQNWRILSEREADWYALYHRGGDLPVHIWMDVEPNEGAGFYIYRPEHAEAILAGANHLDFDPVGAGTMNEYEPGHLFWRGVVPHSSILYVKVVHGWQGDVPYTIFAAGPGLGGPGSVRPEQAHFVEAPQVTQQPATQPTTQVTTQVAAQPAMQPTIQPAAQEGVAAVPGDQSRLIDPPVQAALGQTWRTLGDGQTRWYTFEHRGGNLPVHIWMDVDPNEGAGFRVFRAEDAESIFAGASPDDIAEVGRGSPNPIEPGYLFWRGNIANAGTFYVMVEHGWEGDVNYALYASGPGFVETQQAQFSMMQ
jgi:hypothetical protein